MLVMTSGGRERTAEEFGELFAAAGLRLTRVVSTAGAAFVLEASTQALAGMRRPGRGGTRPS